MSVRDFRQSRDLLNRQNDSATKRDRDDEEVMMMMMR
jgi:hypothetical protein